MRKKLIMINGYILPYGEGKMQYRTRDFIVIIRIPDK